MVMILGGVVSIRPVSGGDWKPLVSDVKPRLIPYVMPDGNWVLYQLVEPSGKFGLYRVRIEGGIPQRLGDSPTPGFNADFFFSPDGRQVLAVSQKPANYDLSVLENYVPSTRK
jgi:Tol biopolymer transport system component